jgi:hypothetical protein
MGEPSEPVAADEHLAGTISHRRLLIEMAAITLVVAVIGWVGVSRRFFAGRFGGRTRILCQLLLLKRSTKAIFDSAIAGGKPTLLALKYILRYVLIGTVAAFFYFTDALPIVAVVLGLAAFAFAVVLDA